MLCSKQLGICLYLIASCGLLLSFTACKKNIAPTALQLDLHSENDIVYLSWNKSDLIRFNRYELYRSASPISDQEYRTSTGATKIATFINHETLSFEDTQTIPGVPSYYRVFAMDNSDEYQASNTCTHQDSALNINFDITQIRDFPEEHKLFLFGYYGYAIYDYKLKTVHTVLTSNINYPERIVPGKYAGQLCLYQVDIITNKLMVYDANNYNLLHEKSIPQNLNTGIVYLNDKVYLQYQPMPSHWILYNPVTETVEADFEFGITLGHMTINTQKSKVYSYNGSTISSATLDLQGTIDAPNALTTTLTTSIYSLLVSPKGKYLLADKNNWMIDEQHNSYIQFSDDLRITQPHAAAFSEDETMLYTMSTTDGIHLKFMIIDLASKKIIQSKPIAVSNFNLSYGVIYENEYHYAIKSNTSGPGSGYIRSFRLN